MQAQAQARSRKRAADGSAVDGSFQYPPMQDPAFNQTDPLGSFRTPLTNDIPANFPDFPSFDTTNNANANAANFFPTQLNSNQAQSYAPSVTPTSNQLVRRNTNQQVARTPQRNQWGNFNNQQAQQTDRIWENMDEDDDQDLDQKAALAKKDAQAKRKQIPPFVQKLSSFLDSSNNTELIRWSDDGNSFIVLDEDEFARTLIPELFKHNNYASFVRQLNMYGFHKKVGLNANSMKAAEKKVKDPSVYWHEYFKRGRPDLLWLIQKPQGKNSNTKRKRDHDKRDPADSDDDSRRQSPESTDRSGGNPGQVTTIPRSEMQTFRSELQKLQRQQSVISKIINQLKEQNEQFYRQATAFQALHDRHENSINAILTFLATFYNRSLEGHAGQNLVNMFNGPMPAPPSAQQGAVFDVGDGDMAENIDQSNNNNNNINNNDSNDNNQQLQRFYRRQQLLLPAPASQNAPSMTPSPMLPSRSSSTPHRETAQQRNLPVPPPQPQTAPQRASVTPVIKDDAETPDLLNTYPEPEHMMDFIQNMNNSPNTGGGPNFDFPAALEHMHTANGNSPLTAEQRNDMLSLIAGQGTPSTSQPGANNALMMPTPPPVPNLEQYHRNRQQIERLHKLQQEQDSKVQDLAGKLQPLSPLGAIPGVSDRGAGFDPNPDLGDFDLGAYINTDPDESSYFPDFGDSAPAPAVPSNQNPMSFPTNSGVEPTGDLDGIWDFTQPNALADADDLFGDTTAGNDEEQTHNGGGRVVGSVSSEGTSPAAAAPEEDEDGTPSKRRRTGT